VDRRQLTASQRGPWHIDKINNARTPAEQLRFAINYALAVLAQADQDRPGDAPGFRRALAHRIASFASAVAGSSRPEARFRDSFPALPGGRLKRKITRPAPRAAEGSPR
jgi:hypothetical protein